MKYVDENAWNALLEGIRNGRLLISDAAARDAAITQLPILNAEIPAMLSSKALNELQLQMTTLLASLDDAKEVELYLANLSYFFHLAAKAWEEAYDHVAATVAVESAAKFLSFLPAKLFILAIKTGISALTAGGSRGSL